MNERTEKILINDIRLEDAIRLIDSLFATGDVNDFGIDTETVQHALARLRLMKADTADLLAKLCP